MTALTLRPYQRRAVEGTFAAWRRGVRRPALVAPTGAGKTIIISEVIQRAHAAGCHRSVVLVHRDELVGQTMDKLASVAPHLRAGVVAGRRDDISARVVVASVATLRGARRREALRGVGLVVVDECHHALRGNSYGTVLQHFGCFTETGALALGVTATMERADKGALGEVWEEIAERIEIAPLIADGHLVRPRAVHVWVEDLDLSKVKAKAGDFSEGALGRALAESMAPDRIVEAVQTHAQGRQGILFAPTVEFAALMAQRLNEAGFPAALVSGSQPIEERRGALKDFRAGKVQWLCNCMVLTEGTDLPMAEVCLIARPTRSAPLFIQMVGRVLRPWAGKKDALVIDVVGASRRHRLASLASLEIEIEEEHDGRVIDLLDDPLLELMGEGQEVDSVEVSYKDGEIRSEFIDIFGASHSAWLQTYGGTWFLRAGDDLIAIIPDPVGGWMVLRAHPRHGDSTGIERGIQDMSYAMAYGEANVTAIEAMHSRKSAGWRRQRATDRQLRKALDWKVEIEGLTRRGEVADAIDIAIASWRLDGRLAHAR